jgi:hypothetical protein
MTRTETESAAPEVAQDEAESAAPEVAQAAEPAKVEKEVAGGDDALHAGLFPESCTQTALEMLLVPTEAFVHATELQRTAVRFRIAAGASAADARASVAKSQGIDLACLFDVTAEAKDIAEILLKQKDRKRKRKESEA